MKPIHEFNDQLKKWKSSIGSREKNSLNFENFHFAEKRPGKVNDSHPM